MKGFALLPLSPSNMESVLCIKTAQAKETLHTFLVKLLQTQFCQDTNLQTIIPEASFHCLFHYFGLLSTVRHNFFKCFFGGFSCLVGFKILPHALRIKVPKQMSLNPLVNIRVTLPKESSHRAARALISSTQRPSLPHTLPRFPHFRVRRERRDREGGAWPFTHLFPQANEVFLLNHQSLLLPSFKYPPTNRPGLRRPCASIYIHGKLT